MTVAGYTFNDKFSDTSRLHAELDFDKIVVGDGSKVIHKTSMKLRDRYIDPLDSGENLGF
jgi:hypothetical protein